MQTRTLAYLATIALFAHRQCGRRHTQGITEIDHVVIRWLICCLLGLSELAWDPANQARELDSIG